MSTVSFKKGGSSAKKKAAPAAKKKAASKKSAKSKALTGEVVDDKEKKPLATRQHNPPAVQSTGSNVAGVEGEIDGDDIRPPRVNVVNALSPLHTEDEYDIGSIVFDKGVEIAAKNGGEVEFVLLRFKKLYQQVLPYTSDETPIVVDSKAEVRAQGGTTNWSKEAKEEGRLYKPMAHVGMAIAMPEDLDESEQHRFPLEFGERQWAVAVTTVAKTAYPAFAVPLCNLINGRFQKTGLHSGLWTMSSEKKTYEDKTWYVPSAKYSGAIEDEEALAFFAELSGLGHVIDGEEGEEG